MAEPVENVTKLNEDNNEDESIITMVDVLEQQERLEEDAFAVLGASDDAHCTYNQGYVKRQALYACKTCFENYKNLAGICLACSYHCHEGHDLIELYTKRNFRCDCGNDLFGDLECSLQPEKDDKNIANNYNQNFKGIYCTCARPYPDPEDDTPDEMTQCIICEDWYHTRHLVSSSEGPGINVNTDSYSEMICHLCTDRLSSILTPYCGYSVSKIKNESSDNDKEILDVSNNPVVDSASLCSTLNSTVASESAVSVGHDQDLKTEEICSSESAENVLQKSIPEPSTAGIVKQDEIVPTESVSSSMKNSGEECKLKSMTPPSEKIADALSGASFWRLGFRDMFCKCSSCMNLYKSHGVAFLTDPLDTVQAYEEEGEMSRNGNRTKPASGYEEGLKALSTLDRVKQVEAIHGYNEMQEHLKAYLTKFAENKKVVRAEDIKEFFSEMQSRKRQKVEVPYFCH